MEISLIILKFVSNLNMNKLLFFMLVFVYLFCKVKTVKIMLIGGALSDYQFDIFDGLAAQTNKKQHNCGTDIKTTECPIVAVITSAVYSQRDGINAYNIDGTAFLSYKKLFLMHGFMPVHILNHIDTYQIGSNLSTSVGKQNLQFIERADVIFFNGGNQSFHIRSWLNNDGTYNNLMSIIVKRAKLNEVVLAGTSAGAMMMSQQTFGQGKSLGMWYFHNSIGLALKNVVDGQLNGSGLFDERNGTNCLQHSQNGGKMFGLNLVSYQTDAHVNARARIVRLTPKLFQLQKSIGIAIDQNTAFLSIDEKVGIVYGENGVTIVDITGAKVQQSTYFKVSNVSLSYLTAKDQYNFKSKTVISSKFLITKPKYDSFTDSNDIMQPNQISLLITRLADQNLSYNVGRVKIPTDYPLDTPSFSMIFSKNVNTKGYFDQDIKVQKRSQYKRWIVQIGKQQQKGQQTTSESQEQISVPQNSKYTVGSISFQMTYS